MTKVPADLHSRSVIAAFKRLGYEAKTGRGSGKGSHTVLTKEDCNVLTVPYGKLKRGTLRELLLAASISVDEFLAVL